MRRAALILVLAGLAGCSSESKPATQPVAILEHSYEPSQATALAFDPPVAMADAPLDLARASREPGAFLGYDDPIRSFLFIRTDDDWNDNGTGRYDRRATVGKISSSTR